MPAHLQIVRKGAKWAGVGLLVLVVYVGSIGPVCWGIDHGFIQAGRCEAPVLDTIYWPLRQLPSSSPPGRMLRDYKQWCWNL